VGFRPDEAQSRDFLTLDIGLPAADIAPWLRQVLGRTRTSTSDVTAVNRRGKTVELRVAASPMRTEEGAVSGLLLVIETDDPE
jgi:two-component system CheB/CheR fusion protein